MRALAAGVGFLVLIAANVVVFAALVPLRPTAVIEYLAQMAAAVFAAPALVLLGMLATKRFRTPRLLVRGALAGLAGSLVLSAASVAWSPPARPRLAAWDAAEKQAHLDQRCRESCHNRGTSQAVCDELCACTIEALFTGRSDAELQRLTAEGLYGTLSRETNQLLGELGARCAQEARAEATAPPPPS